MPYIDVRIEYKEDSEFYDPAKVFVTQTDIPKEDLPQVAEAAQTDFYQNFVAPAMLAALDGVTETTNFDMDYPVEVEHKGQTYTVSVDRDGDGYIQSFQVLDSDGEWVTGGDWGGPVSTEDVLEALVE